MPAPIIELSFWESWQACTAGVARTLKARKRGWCHAHGLTGNGWAESLEGAGGECAVAKHFQKYWLSVVNNPHDPRELKGDVGTYEVRTTTYERGELVIYPKDRDAFFFLVRGEMPKYELAGYIWGPYCKRPEFWKSQNPTRPPAYWVPADLLHDVSEFDGVTKLDLKIPFSLSPGMSA